MKELVRVKDLVKMLSELEDQNAIIIEEEDYALLCEGVGETKYLGEHAYVLGFY